MIRVYRVNISAPNLAGVCVDGVADGCPRGRLYNKYQANGCRFANVYELLKELENTCNLSNYPQSSTQERTFGSQRGAMKEKKKVEQMVSADEILEKSGELATFVIHVKYRQNSTWQGDIFWAEKQEKCNFRSALEMLKLIDSALDSTEAEEASAGEDGNHSGPSDSGAGLSEYEK